MLQLGSNYQQRRGGGEEEQAVQDPDLSVLGGLCLRKKSPKMSQRPKLFICTWGERSEEAGRALLQDRVVRALERRFAMPIRGKL